MVLQSTLVYNYSQSNSSGCMGVGTYTASDKSPARRPHRTLYFLCAQLLQMDHEYCASLQTSILSITDVHVHT